jgi:hypothetical protein
MHDHSSFTNMACWNCCQSSITAQRTPLARSVDATWAAQGPQTAVRRPSDTLQSSLAVATFEWQQHQQQQIDQHVSIRALGIPLNNSVNRP